MPTDPVITPVRSFSRLREAFRLTLWSIFFGAILGGLPVVVMPLFMLFTVPLGALVGLLLAPATVLVLWRVPIVRVWPAVMLPSGMISLFGGLIAMVISIALSPSEGGAIFAVFILFVAGVALLGGFIEGRRIRKKMQHEPSPRCPQCGYATAGLTQPKCPECGKPLMLAGFEDVDRG
jgi:DNA-directed RNA polymerase subunit RPC12/RpoP